MEERNGGRKKGQLCTSVGNDRNQGKTNETKSKKETNRADERGGRGTEKK